LIWCPGDLHRTRWVCDRCGANWYVLPYKDYRVSFACTSKEKDPLRDIADLVPKATKD